MAQSRPNKFQGLLKHMFGSNSPRSLSLSLIKPHQSGSKKESSKTEKLSEVYNAKYITDMLRPAGGVQCQTVKEKRTKLSSYALALIPLYLYLTSFEGSSQTHKPAAGSRQLVHVGRHAINSHNSGVRSENAIVHEVGDGVGDLIKLLDELDDDVQKEAVGLAWNVFKEEQQSQAGKMEKMGVLIEVASNFIRTEKVHQSGREVALIDLEVPAITPISASLNLGLLSSDERIVKRFESLMRRKVYVEPDTAESVEALGHLNPSMTQRRFRHYKGLVSRQINVLDSQYR